MTFYEIKCSKNWEGSEWYKWEQKIRLGWELSCAIIYISFFFLNGNYYKNIYLFTGGYFKTGGYSHLNNPNSDK